MCVLFMYTAQVLIIYAVQLRMGSFAHVSEFRIAHYSGRFKIHWGCSYEWENLQIKEKETRLGEEEFVYFDSQ